MASAGSHAHGRRARRPRGERPRRSMQAVATASRIASTSRHSRGRGRGCRRTGRSARRPGARRDGQPPRRARRASRDGRRARSPATLRRECPSKRSTCERASRLPAARARVRGQPVGVQPACRGHHEQAGLGQILADLRVGLDRLGGHGAESRRSPGSAPGPGGRSSSRRPARARRRSAPIIAVGLVDGPRREAQVDRAAVVACMCSKPQAMITASSSTKAGSNAIRPGCPRPISGVTTDWCAPPSGARVTPEGVATSRNRASW